MQRLKLPTDDVENAPGDRAVVVDVEEARRQNPNENP